MAKKPTFRVSKYCKDESPIYVNDRMTGKMEDVPCIGTSCHVNENCQERIRKALEEGNMDCICLKCYADRTLNCYKDLEERSIENYKLLNSTEIATELLPEFKRFVELCRFEPFGDTGSVLHAVNYIHIAKLNPNVTFGCWTKNPQYYEEAFKICGGKPDNMVMVLSSEMLNVVAKVLYPWVDIVFTVWKSEADCIAAGFNINCGKKKCYDCMHCYTKGNGTVRYVHEIKK